MIKSYQEIVDEIIKELQADENALALILYGSLSRHEESDNSDIDLMVITSEYHLQKRHSVKYGITVEYLEIHMDFIRNFIIKREVPVLFTLADGIVLFDKISVTEQLRTEARQIIQDGPLVNPKWENERYVTKRRSDLTEIYNDLLDVDDETSFNYIASMLINDTIPLLLENKKLWATTRKRTINLLETHCYDGYVFIKTILDFKYSLPEKRNAAQGLINLALKPYGGILKGDAIIFKVTKII